MAHSKYLFFVVSRSSYKTYKLKKVNTLYDRAIGNLRKICEKDILKIPIIPVGKAYSPNPTKERKILNPPHIFVKKNSCRLAYT